MKKWAILAALAVPGAALAGVNLNFDVPYETVVRPNSGSVDVVFTGTIDVLLPEFDVTGLFVEFPSMDNVTFLATNFHPDLTAYFLADLPGVDYSGNLLTVTVQSTDALGFYYLNNSGSGTSPLAEFIVTASDDSDFASDNEFYGLNVVPEPATCAALGLGVLALARRRKKS
jgi:hypothetical protein